MRMIYYNDISIVVIRNDIHFEYHVEFFSFATWFIKGTLKNLKFITTYFPCDAQGELKKFLCNN